MKRKVVITGVGAITPLGVGANKLFERWANGECGLEDGLGRCSDFHAREWLSPKSTRRADRFTQLALVAGDEAVRQAGWEGNLPYDSDRVSCLIGTGVGGMATMEEGIAMIHGGSKYVPPLTIPLMMSNAAPATMAIRYGLTGQVHSLAAACAGGAQAIATSVALIQSGNADAVVTGGSEAALTPLTHTAFRSMDALSNKGISRPFDVRRDGFVLAEGAGILILEAEDLARKREATILGSIGGWASTADGYHITAPNPNARCAARAIVCALKNANLKPKDISYINAHGTSTPMNDRMETAAIKSSLGDAAAHIPVSSTKSVIGHTLGASGAVEAVALLLTLRGRLAPPTVGYEEAEPGLDLDYVPDKAKPLKSPNGDMELAGISNSFGFGGHNVVLCMTA